MADYVPLPFVPQPIDQTSQRMKLADLLYQANLARMQADQQRQMGIAQMVAQLGQQIGGGLEGWMNLQQQERNYALRERQAALQMAREEERQRQFDLNQQRMIDTANLTARRLAGEAVAGGIEQLAGGTEIPKNVVESGGIYAAPLIERTVTEALPARPQTMAFLAGTVPQMPAAEEPSMAEAPAPAMMAELTPTAIPVAPVEKYTRVLSAKEREEGAKKAAVDRAIENMPEPQRTLARQVRDLGLPPSQWPESVSASILGLPQQKPKTSVEEEFIRDRAKQIEKSGVDPVAALGRASAEWNQYNAKPGGEKKELGKTLTATTVRDIADMRTSLGLLDTVEPTEAGGTIQSLEKIKAVLTPDFVTELTGLGAKAKARDAQILLVKQIIGKGLEGGVLRKEDELKFARILPTLSDAPAVARDKIRQIRNAIADRMDEYVNTYESAGYNVGNLKGRTTPSGRNILSIEKQNK